MDWDLQAKFEHLSDGVLTGDRYLEEILNILDTLAGEKQATEMRRTVRKALFEGSRRTEESISQFALRREQEFTMAERYMVIPEELKGIMLEEHAGLGKQGTKNLRTLTGGATDYTSVSRALKILDLEEESIMSKGKSSHFVGVTEESNPGDESEGESSLASEDEKAILAELEKLDLDEGAALEVFVTLEKEKRTWKENKKLKLAQKKDRRHFSDRGSRPYASKFNQKGKRGFNLDAIKKVSRCSNCGDRGHWAEDCQKPYRSKAERLEQERQSGGGKKHSAFVFLGSTPNQAGSSSSMYMGGPSFLSGVEADEGQNALGREDIIETYERHLHQRLQEAGFEKELVSKEHTACDKGETPGSFVGMAMPEFARRILDNLKEKANADIFLTMPPGHAIIDPGAGQDLIGKPAYEQLKTKLATVGLRPVPIDDEPSKASGIGGQATTLFVALVPTILGGAPGIVKVTVVQEDVPHLLSIGLLEAMGSVIDTKQNIIHYWEHGTQDRMTRLKSGHRTVDVTKWSGEGFPVPDQVREQYGLCEGAFNLRSFVAEEAYMVEQPQHGESVVEVNGVSFVIKAHEDPQNRKYVPNSEECQAWHDARVVLKVNESGEIKVEHDRWNEGEVGEADIGGWTGLSIFVKKTERLESHRKLTYVTTGCTCSDSLGSKETLWHLRDSFPPHNSICADALAGHGEAMAPAGRPHPREGETGREAKARRIETLRSSSPVRSGGPQPIRELATVPEVPDEDLIHPSTTASGHSEGQGGHLRHREGLSGDQEGSQGTGGHGESLSGHVEPGSSGEQPPGLADGVESATTGGNDFSPVTGYDSHGGRTASLDGVDPAVSGEPGHHDADCPTESEQLGRNHEPDSPTDEEAPRRRRVGSGTRGLTSVRMDLISTPSVASRPMLGTKLANARTQGYVTEEGKVMVAWETEELFNYFLEEDITDDYEVGISSGVKKATRRVLAEYSESPRDSDFPEKAGDSSPSFEESCTISDSDSSVEISKFKVMELFSPARVTAEILTQKYPALTTTSPPSFDLAEGWDFFKVEDRKSFWNTLKVEDPDLVIMTPECRAFSSLMNVNWERMSPEEQKRLQTAALAMFQFCIQVAEHRLRRGKFFLLEQPDKASSWNTHAAKWLAAQAEVLHLSFDQCMAGLRVSDDGLSRKRTSFMLNHLGIADEISKLQCDGGHHHVILEGGLPHKAQVWPLGLILSIVHGIQNQMVWCGVAEGPAGEEEIEDEEDEVAEENPEAESREDQPLSQEQKEMVKRLHVNLGHLPVERMITMLKAAKAQPRVLKFVKEKFSCETCMKQRKEIRRRRAAIPRTFEFNRIVGADVFYIHWGGKQQPFLNLVDHGSNWQSVALVRPSTGGVPSGGTPSSSDCWHAFRNAWLRPHGAPEIMVTDGGMEFRGRFERGLEQHSVLQHTTDIQSPWQNGRVERHGQFVKSRLEMSLQSASSVVETLTDLEDLAIEIVSCKNQWFSRGGYSPAQLVYGRNPRLPSELLSDAELNSPGWADALCEPAELDTAGYEYRRSHNIREHAKKLAAEATSKEKIREASKPPMHRYRTWSAGQWVLVWRLARGTERARWVGPGLVILQNGHTVYVAMRSRLWKCNSDQLRPASSTEELAMEVVTSGQYRDLLQQMQGQRTGAIDVAREGTPPDDAWKGPAQAGEEAATLRARRESREESSPIKDEAEEGREEIGRGQALRSIGMREERPEAAQASPRAGAGLRRLSIGTLSEPFSEPTGGSGSARSEDTESKRRRLNELQSIPEEPGGSAAAGGTLPVSNVPATSVEAAASSSADRLVRNVSGGRGETPGQVRERVQEIEQRPHMRRRSRSPLPEVLRRQRNEPPQAETPSLVLHVWEDLNQDKKDRAPDMKKFKENCVFFNNHKETAPEPARGEDLFMFATAEEDISEIWAGEPARGGEITWSQMMPEERQEFHKADLKEWESLEKEFKAVKIWKGKDAARLREEFPERIMSSRMVRRKKPMPGLHQYKAKSRFCVHGHKDPDSGTFKTFAPTPTTEALNLVCQVIANEDMLLMFADVKAAFAQSNQLSRPRGRLFVAPCDGVPVEEQDLIELLVPIYGLDDAPVRWYETVTSYLTSLGLRRSILDPCIYLKHDKFDKVETIVLIEVDDFLIASRTKEKQDELKKDLQSRFHFGKWELDTAEFIGRRIQRESNEIKLHQEKYILEKLEPMTFSKGRRSSKDSPLTEAEFKDFRSLLYRVSWVVHQTRPEAAGTVSILSSRLHSATVNDGIHLNKMIGHLRSTAGQGLRIRAFNSKEMTFIGVSDAGGVDGEVRGHDRDGLPEDPVQGAWMVMTSSLLPAHDKKIPVSVLSWRSSKLKRRVTSTMASETMSLSQCIGALEWLQVFYRDLTFGDVKTNNWRAAVSPFMLVLPEECELIARQEQCSITDAKSLYDAIYKQCPASRQDRRTALELAVIVDAMQKTGSHIRWTPHPRMPVDVMTKSDITKGNGALLHLLKHACLRIDKEENELLRRQRDANARSRTRSSSTKLLRSEEDVEEYYFGILQSLVWSTEIWVSWQTLAPHGLREVYSWLTTHGDWCIYAAPICGAKLG